MLSLFVEMSKIPTDVPNIFKIAMKSGQERLWCGECKKFLSNASGGAHDCDPNWRSRLQRGRKAASGNGKTTRRWKLTPKRKVSIEKLASQAVRYEIVRPYLNALVKKTKGADKALMKKLKAGNELKKLAVVLKRIGF